MESAAGGEPCREPAISHDSHHVSLVQWTNLFASRHKGHRFKSPGGYLCGTGILLLAMSCYIPVRTYRYVYLQFLKAQCMVWRWSYECTLSGRLNLYCYIHALLVPYARSEFQTQARLFSWFTLVIFLLCHSGAFYYCTISFFLYFKYPIIFWLDIIQKFQNTKYTTGFPNLHLTRIWNYNILQIPAITISSRCFDLQ